MTFTGKIAKPRFAISLEKKKKKNPACLPLKISLLGKLTINCIWPFRARGCCLMQNDKFFSYEYIMARTFYFQ